VTTTLRSGRFTSWLRSWRAGLISPDDVAAAVVGEDAEHEMADLPGQLHAEGFLPALFRLSTVDPTLVRVVLPTPGDPRGLPGPGVFTTAALATGEGVVCDRVGLVPEVIERSSGSGDVWTTVMWRAHDLLPGVTPPDVISLPDAEHDLLEELRTATETLQYLDVARWRPELGTAVHSVRDPSTAALPPGYDPRAERVLHRAEVVSRIISLAAADAPGGAVSAHEAAERDVALRPLATAARRARIAAYNSPLR
jgi:hypothetical protein